MLPLVKYITRFVYYDLGLRTEEKCFFVIQIPVRKVIGKAATWTIMCFSISVPNVGS